MKHKTHRIIPALGMALLFLLTATATGAMPPPFNTVVDNLQCTERYDAEPWFRCYEMSVMSFRFFDKADYQPTLVLGFDNFSTRYSHMWVESPQFDTGMYYEATTKEMASLSDLSRFTERHYYTTEDNYNDYYWQHLHELLNAESPKYVCDWEDWYDWRWTGGDFDDDGDINLFDFVEFIAAYDSVVTQSKYEMLGDMDLDGDIDLADFVAFSEVYGANIQKLWKSMTPGK